MTVGLRSPQACEENLARLVCTAEDSRVGTSVAKFDEVKAVIDRGYIARRAAGETEFENGSPPSRGTFSEERASSSSSPRENGHAASRRLYGSRSVRPIGGRGRRHGVR